MADRSVVAENFMRYVCEIDQFIDLRDVRSVLDRLWITLVGCGAIGRRVARIASVGLRMNVVGYDVVDIPEDLRREAGSSFAQETPVEEKRGVAH